MSSLRGIKTKSGTGGEELRIPPVANDEASSGSERSTLRDVEYAMSKIAPLELADRSWDNVGTLLEAPEPRTGKGIFLAIDLTPSVVEELLSDANESVSVAIVYHPCIFKGLKALTFSSSSSPNPLLVRSLLRLSAAGISIYCPHTSLDAVPNGINDWLAFCVSSDKHFSDCGLAALTGSWKPITPSKSSQFGDKAGMGRIVSLDKPVKIAKIVERLKRHLGLKHREWGTLKTCFATCLLTTLFTQCKWRRHNHPTMRYPASPSARGREDRSLATRLLISVSRGWLEPLSRMAC